MKNILIMLSLLIAPYGLLALADVPDGLRGRIAISVLFLFAGIGHFVKTSEMAGMLPAWVPGRVAIVYVTGIFEVVAAVAVLIDPLYRFAGLALCGFLVLVFPANVYAAIQRVDFGGHRAGPSYLLIRLPLQAFLIAWVYWFAVHGQFTLSR